MATTVFPYADIGKASFEQMDTYLNTNLLAGLDPEFDADATYAFPVPLNTSFEQFSVVGLDATGNVAMATNGESAVAATGTLTFSGAGTADDTVTIGSTTYTLKAAVGATNDVLIGASATDTAANLAAAINGSGTPGTSYGAGTNPNPDVTASASSGVITLTAAETGIDGNAVATTETSSAAAFGAATLTGGSNAVGVQPIGVLAHAVSLGSSGSANATIWYKGCYNQTALVWDPSFNTDAAKQKAFFGAPTPTNIIVRKRDAVGADTGLV